MRKHLARIAQWIKNRHNSDINLPSSVSVPIEKPLSNCNEVNVLPEIDGSVAFVDSNFNITDPEGIGMYASISVPEEFKHYVFIDGQRANRQSIILTSTSSIKVEIPSVLPKMEVNFGVSNDKLSVSMAVVLIHGARYVVGPFEPTAKAVLKTEEIVVPAVPPCYEELLERLQAQEFKGNIDEQALRDLSKAVDSMERVVLRGQPAIPGTPPIVKPAPISQGHDPLGRIKSLDTVKIGAVVFYIEDGTPAIPGIDVYGLVICASEATVSLPTLGIGVTRLHNNIIAIRPGRVSFTRTLVDVIPQLVLHEDITPKEGYISFEGDVVIYGSVQDGSQIKANGQVIVHGGVFGSTIVSALKPRNWI